MHKTVNRGTVGRFDNSTQSIREHLLAETSKKSVTLRTQRCPEVFDGFKTGSVALGVVVECAVIAGGESALHSDAEKQPVSLGVDCDGLCAGRLRSEFNS